MIPGLIILTALILSVGWFLCSTLRMRTQEARWQQLEDESLRQITNAQHVVVPVVTAPIHDGLDTL